MTHSEPSLLDKYIRLSHTGVSRLFWFFLSVKLWLQLQTKKRNDHRAPVVVFVRGVRGAGMTPLDFASKVILNTTVCIRCAGCVATAL